MPESEAIAVPSVPEVPAPQKHHPKLPLQLFIWRGSQSQYMTNLSIKFSNLMATEIVAMCQSESDGNIDLTIVYR